MTDERSVLHSSMDEFLSAAKAFDEQARHPIDRYDLGVALLLEFFCGPILRYTKYTPLSARSAAR